MLLLWMSGVLLLHSLFGYLIILHLYLMIDHILLHLLLRWRCLLVLLLWYHTCLLHHVRGRIMMHSICLYLNMLLLLMRLRLLLHYRCLLLLWWRLLRCKIYNAIAVHNPWLLSHYKFLLLWLLYEDLLTRRLLDYKLGITQELSLLLHLLG